MHALHQFAYLDAGTGSIIVQALIGIFLGGAVVMRTKARKIFTKLTGRKHVEDKDEDSEE